MENFEINEQVNEGYLNQLKNRLYACLCEYENEGTWEAFLDSILMELLGYPEDLRTINFYIVFYKISSCRFLSYKYFRKTIFDTMSLISKGL